MHGDCASGNRANSRFGGGDAKGCAANRFCDANARLQQAHAAREPIAASVISGRLIFGLLVRALLGGFILRSLTAPRKDPGRRLERCGRLSGLCPVQRFLKCGAIAGGSRLKSALTTFQGASNPGNHLTILLLMERETLL